MRRRTLLGLVLPWLIIMGFAVRALAPLAKDMMTPSMAITFVSLLCAIFFAVVATVMAERRGPEIPGARLLAWAALLSSCGACVGIVSALLIQFFALGELVSLAISVPLGALAFFLLAWLLG